MLPVRGLVLTAIFMSCVLGAAVACAQDSDGADYALVLEVGGAGEWPVRGGAPNFGGTLAGEVTPIENWLELELGVTALATAGYTELSGDFLFKKPFRLSSVAEFMIGAGPSLVRTLSGREKGTSLSAEFDLDFMFWSLSNLGWYVEPSWSVDPKNGERSVGLNAGLLIGLP